MRGRLGLIGLVLSFSACTTRDRPRESCEGGHEINFSEVEPGFEISQPSTHVEAPLVMAQGETKRIWASTANPSSAPRYVGSAGAVSVEELLVVEGGNPLNSDATLLDITCVMQGNATITYNVVPHVEGEVDPARDAYCELDFAVECVTPEPGTGTATDPANDCSESSGTTADTCSGGIDIVAIDVDKSNGIYTFSIEYREPAIEEPGNNQVYYGFSIRNSEDINNTVQVSMHWYGEGITDWDVIVQTGQLSADIEDYPLGEQEFVGFENGKFRVSLEQAKVDTLFAIETFSTSAALTYPDGLREEDKSPGHPFQ